jgi:hypothetical protein
MMLSRAWQIRRSAKTGPHGTRTASRFAAPVARTPPRGGDRHIRSLGRPRAATPSDLRRYTRCGRAARCAREGGTESQTVRNCGGLLHSTSLDRKGRETGAESCGGLRIERACDPPHDACVGRARSLALAKRLELRHHVIPRQPGDCRVGRVVEEPIAPSNDARACRYRNLSMKIGTVSQCPNANTRAKTPTRSQSTVSIAR